MNRNGTAIILIVLAIGIYVTFTRSLIAEIKAVQVVNNQYKTAISNAEQLISVREKVLEAYNSLTDLDKERLGKMIPNTVDNIRLVIDLKELAKRHGFILEDVKASTAAAKTAPPVANARAQQSGSSISTPVIDNITVSFSVEAPYLKFVSFLQDIEANLRIMDLTRLSVSVDDNSPNSSYSVELKTYWLRQ